MNLANIPPSMLRPELRAQLQRLDELERGERKRRHERWHVEPATERESESWLFTYLDLITLLLVMLVVMLALSGASRKSASAPPLAATAAAEAGTAVAAPPDGRPSASASDGAPVPAGALAADTESGRNPPPHALVGSIGHSKWLLGAADIAPIDLAMAISLPPLPASAPSAAPEADAGTMPAPAYRSIADIAHELARRAQAASGGEPAMPLTVSALLALAAQADGQPAIVPTAAAGIVNETPEDPTPPAPSGPAQTPPPEPAPLPTLAELGLDTLGAGIDVIINTESISFRINNDILFDSGQTALAPSGLEVLGRLAPVLARNDYRIAVEGHTDTVPISNDRFPSNWELATGRATSVLRQLQAHGIAANRLRAVGYADTRPLASNQTAQGRAINRRVELIMETGPSRDVAPQSSSASSSSGTTGAMASSAPLLSR